MPNDREPTDPGLASPGSAPHIDRAPTEPARSRNPFDPAREPTDPSDVDGGRVASGVAPGSASSATEDAAPGVNPSQQPAPSQRAPATPSRGVLPPLPHALITRLADVPSPDSPPTVVESTPTLGPLPLPSPPTSPARRIEEVDAELSEASGARLRDVGAEEYSVSGAVQRRRAQQPSRKATARNPEDDAELSEFSGAALRDLADAEHSVSGRQLRRGRAEVSSADAEHSVSGRQLRNGRADGELSSAVAERLRVIVDHELLEEADAASADRSAEVGTTSRAPTRVRPLAPRLRDRLRAATLPSGPPGLARRRTWRRRLLAWGIGVGVGLALALAVVFLSNREPGVLTSSPLTRSFGTTADVDFRAPGGKTFHYAPRAGGRVISVLHYRADGLLPGALLLRLNGELLSEVEPSADDTAVRHRVRVLPDELLARERPARIEFRPAGPTARWRIDDLWVEEVPAAADAEAAQAESRRQAARGRDALNRSVANPAALFEAWVAFRRAWVVLEPLQPRSPLYAELRAKYDAITGSLDAQCAAMLLAAERSIRQRDVRGAQESLAAVQRYFPTGEHHCHNRALELTAEHGL